MTTDSKERIGMAPLRIRTGTINRIMTSIRPLKEDTTMPIIPDVNRRRAMRTEHLIVQYIDELFYINFLMRQMSLYDAFYWSIAVSG